MSEPRPSWTATPVVTDAVNVPSQSYVVVPGDTLRGIADKTGAGSEAIARANHIDQPFTVYTGQKLQIPGGRYHRVKRGESGIAIARAYGVPWHGIVDLNELEDPYRPPRRANVSCCMSAASDEIDDNGCSAPPPLTSASTI